MKKRDSSGPVGLAAVAPANEQHTCAQCTERDKVIQQQSAQIDFMRTKLNAIVMILQSQ